MISAKDTPAFYRAQFREAVYEDHARHGIFDQGIRCAAGRVEAVTSNALRGLVVLWGR